MKEPDWEKATEEDIWKYVAYHLAINGIESILVGGSVVSIYSKGIYRSGDLDLVCKSYAIKYSDLVPIMKDIGFIKHRAGRHFEHPKCKHIFVEYISPPVMISNDYNINPAEILVNDKVIKLLSPTDCIKDRLASFIYFKSRESLDQAVLVALNQPFNLKEIKNWCDKEGKQTSEGYKEFIRELKINDLL